MEEFPSNSHKSKASAPKEERPALERVVESEVVVRKKPWTKRVFENFIGGDAKSVSEYVTFDLLIPGAKNMLADLVSQGIERTLFGEARSTSRRTGRPGGGLINHVNYAAPYRGSTLARREEPRNSPSSRARATFDFSDIIIPKRVEAEATLDRMLETLERYEQVSVAEYYNLVGVTAEYTDRNYGWFDLRDARIIRRRDGYLIDFPRPEPL